jgi:hypothetical protein
MVSVENDSGNMIRLLYSLANLFCLSESNRSIGKDMDLASTVKDAKIPSSENVEEINLIKEVKDYLINILK